MSNLINNVSVDGIWCFYGTIEGDDWSGEIQPLKDAEASLDASRCAVTPGSNISRHVVFCIVHISKLPLAPSNARPKMFQAPYHFVRMLKRVPDVISRKIVSCYRR